MKIIVPLAGEDQSFKTKFKKPKSLTKVGNKTIIENFIDNLRLKAEFIFICKLSDLIENNLLSLLKELKVKKKIISIDKPTSSTINTVLNSDGYVKDNEDVLIAHPDGIQFFDEKKFYEKIKLKKLSGMPFVFDKDNQSNMSNQNSGRVLFEKSKIKQILEKSPKNKHTKTLSGLYYFKKWSEFKKYSEQTFVNQEPVQGRYFISQVYNEYIKDQKKLDLFYVDKFIDLGNVELVDEYNFWHIYFKHNFKFKPKKKFNFLNLIPSCGEGKRFLDQNNSVFKPLLKIDNNNFLLKKTIDSLPLSKKNIVIIREDHDKKYNFSKKINKINNTKVHKLKNKTDGMARTCDHYLKNIKDNPGLLLSSCDYSVVFNEDKFSNLIEHFDPDVIIWTYKGYPDPRLAPFAYAYLEIKNGYVSKISEKVPISENPHLDHIAQGIFYFKSKKIFTLAFNKMVQKKNTINNEYYVGNSINELIKLNYKVMPFEVDQYICLGTPEGLPIHAC